MDLSTNYLGLRLENPVVAGASPMSRDLGSCRALEDAGVSAIVLYSLFEEQITHAIDEHEHFEQFGAESFPEALSYSPSLDYFPRGPEQYLEHVTRVKQAVEIPVIASLNGHTLGGWTDYARLLQQAGADAIELNVYHVATDPAEDAKAVEDRYVEILRTVRDSVSIPVAIKLGPYFSSLTNFAVRLDKEGADGLVLFNRFYQSDINLETLEVVPNLALSAHHEMRLPLRWIAILDPLVEASLAGGTGIYTATDVIKMMMVGADVAMVVARLLRDGPHAATEVLRDIKLWMHEHEYDSIHQMQGSMNHRACADPSQFERANYMQALHTYV